ncbi:MAG: nucleotidyltransferase family protein [Candidatus Melainabacteria bacterium]|nr:nucleotidyltransferase family protein [Candidatus Melainabacteria bacterium]
MKAIILAGGKGERLSPFTNNCPKGMLKIEGKPILEYQLQWLVKYGVTQVIFACGYLNEVIKDYFGNGERFSVEIEYSVESEPLGRGGAVKKAWDKILSDEAIIVTNGDIYTEMNLQNAIIAHKNNKPAIATICLFPYKSPYGIVRMDANGFVDGFDEKRTLPYWVNGGIYIFEHEVKKYLPDRGDHETTTFPQLAKEKLMFGYKSMDYWRGIDTVKDLNEFTCYTKILSIR